MDSRWTELVAEEIQTRAFEAQQKEGKRKKKERAKRRAQIRKASKAFRQERHYYRGVILALAD